MQALVSRKAILGGQAALTNHLSCERGTIEALLILALQVPLVLDSTDLLRSEQTRNRAVVLPSEVYGMAVCLDRAFNNWFVDYELRQTKLRRRPCDFHSFLGANAFSLCWCLKLLLLECTECLDSLASTKDARELETVARQAMPQTWTKQADSYANLLLDACYALPKFKRSVLSIALCMRAPLNFARMRWSRCADDARVRQVLELEDQSRRKLKAFG